MTILLLQEKRIRRMDKSTIYTIGVYGFSECDFFDKLISNKIDIFCDIRLRRGMRGSKYSFVNSKYLQKKLDTLGIQYIHSKELAPSKETRQFQKDDDIESKKSKRERILLSDLFIEKYHDSCISHFNFDEFVEKYLSGSAKIIFFCVEKSPLACHRSIVAKPY